MSRSRNIKPGFFRNELLVELPFEYRLLFIGLWTLADREGRLEDRPTKIRMEIFPGDSVDVESGLQALHDNGFINRYTIDGRRYCQVTSWAKHQNPHHREVASTIPVPVEPRASLGLAPDEPESSPGSAVLIPDSLNLIPDSKESARGAPPPIPKKDRQVTFTAWLRSIPDGEAAVPDAHHVFAYADKVGIPRDYLALAWEWFEDKYAESGKRYTDWATVFAKSVKGNWAGIWWIDGDGKYGLTTKGRQLSMAAQNDVLTKVEAA